mmetsp:Transcript_12808/g.26966  ORF Transcript_12808/g.26966 Transcript_12808/m.26966 type:complete len:261 (+) Transcript_12808:3752-4534(+)
MIDIRTRFGTPPSSTMRIVGLVANIVIVIIAAVFAVDTVAEAIHCVDLAFELIGSRWTDRWHRCARRTVYFPNGSITPCGRPPDRLGGSWWHRRCVRGRRAKLWKIENIGRANIVVVVIHAHAVLAVVIIKVFLWNIVESIIAVGVHIVVIVVVAVIVVIVGVSFYIHVIPFPGRFSLCGSCHYIVALTPPSNFVNTCTKVFLFWRSFHAFAFSVDNGVCITVARQSYGMIMIMIITNSTMCTRIRFDESCICNIFVDWR